MWQNKYIGIPFKAGGRTDSGLDCWGLVRLIYENEYNINLPSFSDEYVVEDNQRIVELISQYKEGWKQLEEPKPGCVVLFRIFGEATHLGVMIDHKTFIHVRRGSNTVLDTIENTRWKHRTLGFYSYSENKSVVLNAVPHPLKTVRVTSVLNPGMNLEQVYEKINLDNNVDPELSKSVAILVNGIPIPRVAWSTYITTSTDVIEYRAVPGDETVRMIAFIALAVVAPQLIPALEGAILSTEIGMALGSTVVGSAVVTAAATAAVYIAGSYLINAIAPIRPPSNQDPGSAERQDLITGANNIFNPYGAIPVVLGKSRITAPLGAKSFISYPEERESYLNMLLIWGYGPLTLTNFRIGEVNWDEYQFNVSLPNNGRITFDRKTPISEIDQANFDKIYGNDVDQDFSNVEMIGPEWNQAGSGGTASVIVNNGGTVVFDPLTGIILNAPPDVIDEAPYIESPGA